MGPLASADDAGQHGLLGGKTQTLLISLVIGDGFPAFSSRSGGKIGTTEKVHYGKLFIRPSFLGRG